MQNPELIKIAVTGHTNSGKTTLIQTLIKKEIGEIDDRANVTPNSKPVPYEYEGLQASFIDTPGFQQANLLLFLQQQPQGLTELNSELEKKLNYDMKAWKAIKSSDVILYIVSLETVPDDSHEEEIKLVVSAQKGVVALLNKGISLLQVNTKSNVDPKLTKRIKQWEKVLDNSGVFKNFEFDAHWYNPDQVVEIYSAIKECLPPDKKLFFEESLSAFQEHQENKVNKACNLIFKCLDKCRQTITVQTSAFDYNLDKSKEEAVFRMSELLYNAVIDFINNASELYYEVVVPLNIHDAIINNPKPNIRRKTNIRELLIYTGSTTSGLTALGTTLGVAVGASASTVLTGGVGAGILIGAQVGSVIGSCLGGILGIVDNAQTDIIAQVSTEKLGEIQCICITVIWALLQHGFAVGKEVDESVSARRYEIVPEVCTATDFDWLSADKEQIIDRCAKNLSELNKIPLAHIANTENGI
ncbi:GTPase domain-containing protein [Dapis sp. BLCC M172]|uniref:GTPase domain-containing protein n=1 Tax=Dapis sp. BLCC M172 TaxID=2975281 RepID=UPI003CEC73B5